jgi:hypothetical protein
MAAEITPEAVEKAWDRFPNLETVVARRTWPTPVASDLQAAVLQWPTPTANRWDGLQSHGVNAISGSLNPTWVEWLQGYPLGWTEL